MKNNYGTHSHFMRFNTEEKCRQYLIDKVWGGRPKCPNCGNQNMNYYLKTRQIYKCSCCKTQFNITKGTIFENSKIELVKWFHAIYFFTTMKRGVSSCQLARMLEIGQSSAWFMLHRLREVMKDENEGVLIGHIEIDGTTITSLLRRDTRLKMRFEKHKAEQKKIHGKTRSEERAEGERTRGRKKGDTKEVREARKLEKLKKGKRQQFGNENKVLGMTERGGRTILKHLGNNTGSQSRDNILPHIENYITPISRITTDGNSVYLKLKELFLNTETVIHYEPVYRDGRFYNKKDKTHDITGKVYVQDGKHTNTIENVWLHLKKMVKGTYFHINSRYTQRYLNEHSFRWNRKTQSNDSIFEEFMPLVMGKTIKHRELLEYSFLFGAA